MKFGYTIVYVPQVEQSLTFFEQAFGFGRRFLHESGAYGELETGQTTLAFASVELGKSNFPAGYTPPHPSALPLGVELVFVTPDVKNAHQHALHSGATELAPPSLKPWGQEVSFLRCPAGTLIELCSPLGE